MSTMLLSESRRRRIISRTFANLRRHGLKLNPEKCVFGAQRGKLLGCMITERGIEAKIEAIGGAKVDRQVGFT